VDPKTLPKGSLERKAAVAAKRREHAARIRARKAEMAQSASPGGPSDGTANDGNEVGEQKLTNQEVIEWVWEHLGEARCPPAPNRKARELWRYAKKNRDGFLDKYLPIMLRGEIASDKGKKEPERTVETVIGPEMGKLEKWLEEYKQSNRKRCPKCGHTESLQNGYEIGPYHPDFENWYIEVQKEVPDNESLDASGGDEDGS
jgi:hypothetical protein